MVLNKFTIIIALLLAGYSFLEPFIFIFYDDFIKKVFQAQAP